MTLHELIWKLEDLSFLTEGDPEVYIQVAGMQSPIVGEKLFPETGYSNEAIVIGDKKEPVLII